MKPVEVVLTVNNRGHKLNKAWEETMTCDFNTMLRNDTIKVYPDIKDWGKMVVKWFNSTRRAGESERVFVDIRLK